MTLCCIAVDDEPLSLAKIEGFIGRIPYLKLVSSFNSALDALVFLKQHPVDLVFLDVQMDNLTGIQLIEILNPKPAVILTTAYDQYALKGYELNISDYLLKPFSFERFLKAVEKVYQYLQQSNATHQAGKEQDGFVFLKTEYRLEKVNFDDILYIESRGDYLYVIMRHAKILTLMTLKNISGVLPEEKFIRVHKSYMVAINKIEAIEHGRIRIREAVIPIGDTYREAVWKRLAL
jgi:two-component system LytT family response regulator